MSKEVSVDASTVIQVFEDFLERLHRVISRILHFQQIQ